MHVDQLIPVLQVAIGPVILVSGVGLLLLSMTNRIARVVDRSRLLARALRQHEPDDTDRARKQLTVLWRRAVLLRRAITLATISVLCAAILVIVLFLDPLVRCETAWAIGGLFVACMVSLIASLACFIGDLHHSLRAVRLDIAPWLPDGDDRDT